MIRGPHPQADVPSPSTGAVLHPHARPDESDSILLERVRAGDPQAGEDFVRRSAGPMLAVARRYLRCEHDAADAVQEAFQSVFRNLESFSGQSKLSTWMHRIVVNVCLMKLRSSKSRPSVSIESLLPTYDETGHRVGSRSAWGAPPPEQLEKAELREKVRACIDRLPDPYRVVLLLRDIEELDTQETADRLGLSVPAVKVRLHRARQALRTLLESAFMTDSGIIEATI
ncbi:MAG: hypothetical protein FLDDKLPJ_01742 [Phycisphaerae bacterium]|nr:hypothetical protein [Phycisphaerae bacterium]